MTLAALKEYEPVVAGQILAGAALAEGPDPGTGSFADDHHRAQIRAVQEEIRAQLKIAPDDQSPDAIAKISNAIFEAIKATVVGEDAERAAIGRLGQKGAVPPHFYEAVITKDFTHRFSGIGVKNSMVNQAIAEPDRFEHVWADRTSNENDALCSFFLKRQPQRGSVGSWLLVQALRQGIQQLAQAAWLIFDDEFKVGTASLVDILELFAAKYGVDVMMGGVVRRFIREVKTPAEKGRATATLTVRLPPLADIFQTFSIQILSESEARAGLAYAIDMPRYKQSLRLHGIIR